MAQGRYQKQPQGVRQVMFPKYLVAALAVLWLYALVVLGHMTYLMFISVYP